MWWDTSLKPVGEKLLSLSSPLPFSKAKLATRVCELMSSLILYDRVNYVLGEKYSGISQELVVPLSVRESANLRQVLMLFSDKNKK